MLRFLKQQPKQNDHEILRQYRDYLERVPTERSSALPTPKQTTTT